MTHAREWTSRLVSVALAARSVSGAFAATLALAAVAQGAPRVTFDLPPTAECRDVTPDDLAARHSDERWIEIRLPVSLYLAGSETELTEIAMEWHLETPHAQVVDFSPKTSLTDKFAGSVEVVQTAESSRGAGLSISGAEANVKATGTADAASSNAKTVKYQEIPAKEIVSASGTLRRGQGVYFKLRRTALTTVQGSHEFSAVVRVPSNWRGDVLYVACDSTARREREFPATPFGDSTETFSAGSARFQVALFVEGDDQARLSARRFADADGELRRKMGEAERYVARKLAPTPLHKLGSALDLYEPKLPENWQATLLSSPEQVKRTEFRRALPPDLVETGELYWMAKQDLVGLR